MPRGLFISFEGGEGAGKTTQIELLRTNLKDRGYDVVKTREPGGTPDAEKIRDLLVQRDGGSWSPVAELLLFFAARNHHVENLIKPSLAVGRTVITDRFADSTRAYQSFGRGMPLEIIDTVNKLSLGDFEPDLTFILDIETEEGLRRSTKSMSASTDVRRKTEDRFETVGLEFHRRIRQGFLSLAQIYPQRCKVIDAAQPVDKVAADVWAIVEQKLKSHG
jgi:dTMP kinase